MIMQNFYDGFLLFDPVFRSKFDFKIKLNIAHGLPPFFRFMMNASPSCSESMGVFNRRRTLVLTSETSSGRFALSGIELEFTGLISSGEKFIAIAICLAISYRFILVLPER